MSISYISIELVVHLILWILGFLFLFRIPYCRSTRTRIDHYPSISIIIPARNEENSLPNLLASLKLQISAADEVIVVNDHSEDRTKAVAQQSGVKVIESQPTPEGWIGKTWACYQGSKMASGEILIFLDADTVLEENGLRNIIESYVRRDGLVSIQPYHKMCRLYEQLSAFFNIVLMSAMGAFTIFGNQINPLGLFGPVLVLKKEYYVDFGGHEQAKDEILENLTLGSELKKRKFEIYCYGGKHTVSFRMYPNGITELINGWSKGFAVGAVKTSISVLILIVAWITGSIGTTRNLVEAVIEANAIQMVVWGILYIFYVAQIYWMLLRIGNFKFNTALFYPIPLLFFVLVFTYSFARIFLGRNVKWKGREIDLKRKVSK